MYAGGFKQVQYKEYICWMQVKIYISDQTSLRICNSVPSKSRRVIVSAIYVFETLGGAQIEEKLIHIDLGLTSVLYIFFF